MEDLRRILPIKWKTGLKVGAEHFTHLDDRMLLLLEVLTSVDRRASGIIYHTLPAGQETQPVTVTPRHENLTAEIEITIDHGFVARTPAGSLIVAIPGRPEGSEPLVTSVPLESRGAAAHPEFYYVLLSKVDRSTNPDDTPPDGSLEIHATGLLDRKLALSYPGLMVSAERVTRVLDAPAAHENVVPIARLSVQGQKVSWDKTWVPPCATFRLSTRIHREKFELLRQQLLDVRKWASSIRQAGAIPERPEKNYLHRYLAVRELALIVSNAIASLGPLEDTSSRELWSRLMIPTMQWVADAYPGVLARTPSDDGILTYPEDYALGHLGTSDIAESVAQYFEALCAALTDV